MTETALLTLAIVIGFVIISLLITLFVYLTRQSL